MIIEVATLDKDGHKKVGAILGQADSDPEEDESVYFWEEAVPTLELFNTLGDEGWEFVGASPIDWAEVSQSTRFLFKRPIQGK